jgi:hypothetical protein
MRILMAIEGVVLTSPGSSRALLADFEIDSAALKALHRAWLDALVSTFRKLKVPRGGKWHVVITGRASKSGSAEHNLKLSEARVQSVREYLLSRLGGLPVEVQIVHLGEACPFDAKISENGKDRSVEVFVTMSGHPVPPPPVKRYDPPPGTATKQFELRLVDFLVHTIEGSLPFKGGIPIGGGWGWITAQIELTEVDADTTVDYTFRAHGFIAGLSLGLFLGGCRAVERGKRYHFNAARFLKYNSFEGDAFLYPGKSFRFGGNVYGRTPREAFPFGKIEPFDLPKAGPSDPSKDWHGTMKLGYVDLNLPS